MDQIARNRPTMVIEVLPESGKFASLIAKPASAHDYKINVIPAYGSEKIVVVDPDQFDARTPQRNKSKDVVLASERLV